MHIDPKSTVLVLITLMASACSKSDGKVALSADVAPSAMASVKPEPAQPQTADAVHAWVFAQEFVKRSLKSPSTADFGGVLHEPQSAEECCKKHGSDAWLCVGWVDAQNAFGATVRSDFKVTLKPGGTADEWIALEGPALAER
jgi:hypothetical protein